MEIQLNKDLQKFQDNFFMGLNVRQTIFGGICLGLGVAAFVVSTKQGLNAESASWLCAGVVLPFAALGFVNYNGMTFERLVKVWIKQYILCPKKVVTRLENILYIRDKQKIDSAQEKEAKRND